MDLFLTVLEAQRSEFKALVHRQGPPALSLHSRRGNQSALGLSLEGTHPIHEVLASYTHPLPKVPTSLILYFEGSDFKI